VIVQDDFSAPDPISPLYTTGYRQRSKMWKFFDMQLDGTAAGRPLTLEDFNAMFKTFYATGASPDIVYFDEPGVDRLWRIGALARREYAWLKLKFLVGRLKRSVASGVRSVRRTTGTDPTA